VSQGFKPQLAIEVRLRVIILSKRSIKETLIKQRLDRQHCFEELETLAEQRFGADKGDRATVNGVE
jgi:hypothetical protein